MSTMGWGIALFSLCHVIWPASAADPVAARAEAEGEVPPWQMWGPYRPNLYFGVRPQIPETFLMGLMWASGESRDEILESTYPRPTLSLSDDTFPLTPFHLWPVYLEEFTYSSPRYVRAGRWHAGLRLDRIRHSHRWLPDCP